MKDNTIKNIALIILFIVFTYSLIQKIHEETTEKEKLTIIEMQKINSQWITDTIDLPKNCKLMVVASQGTYSLDYKEKGNDNRYPIRGGIIDFKIIRKIEKN